MNLIFSTILPLCVIVISIWAKPQLLQKPQNNTQIIDLCAGVVVRLFAFLMGRYLLLSATNSFQSDDGMLAFGISMIIFLVISTPIAIVGLFGAAELRFNDELTPQQFFPLCLFVSVVLCGAGIFLLTTFN